MLADGNALFEDTHYGILVTDRGQIDVYNSSQVNRTRSGAGCTSATVPTVCLIFGGHTTLSLSAALRRSLRRCLGRLSLECPSPRWSQFSGNYVQIRGVEPTVEGDLSYRESFGPLLDAFTPDGNVIYENPNAGLRANQRGRPVGDRPRDTVGQRSAQRGARQR